MTTQSGMPQVVVGADGCPDDRWFAFVGVRARDAYSYLPSLFDDLESLYRSINGASLALIDVPIGLPSSRRQCDLEAKKVLGAHHSRVFFAPGREVLACGTYPQANELSRKLTGFGLSKQLWAIAPRIRATDEFLRGNPGASKVVRECHPEICLWSLAGHVMAPNKKTAEGFEARIKALSRFTPDASELIARAMKQFGRFIQRDDAVDALAAAVTAAASPAELRTLPRVPERDELGMAVEMVYRIAVTS